jgi:hypothetical protein
MMPRNRWRYVNRSALTDQEPSMTASNLGRPSAEFPVEQNSVSSRPMSHQNSGDHGHEIYPQQFVRLVGCHQIHAPPAQEPDEGKLH